jgi:hypothetical protein
MGSRVLRQSSTACIFWVHRANFSATKHVPGLVEHLDLERVVNFQVSIFKVLLVDHVGCACLTVVLGLDDIHHAHASGLGAHVGCARAWGASLLAQHSYDSRLTVMWHSL